MYNIVPFCCFNYLEGGIVMGFQKGKLIKNILYGVTHPLEMAREKPIMFMLMVGSGVFFMGVAKGWWSVGALSKLFN